ncbi:MAG: thioredoxin family protein [Bacillota bacterium]|nr:thioredoxin family protein [Bacillota bacterium]
MIELTKENFEAEVKQAAGLVFVDFWSPKCGQCMELLPDVEALAEKNAGKAKFCKLDAAANRRLAIAEKVMGLPVFNFYKDGERVFSFDKDSIDMAAVQAKLDELAG